MQSKPTLISMEEKLEYWNTIRTKGQIKSSESQLSEVISILKENVTQETLYNIMEESNRHIQILWSHTMCEEQIKSGHSVIIIHDDMHNKFSLYNRQWFNLTNWWIMTRFLTRTRAPFVSRSAGALSSDWFMQERRRYIQAWEHSHWLKLHANASGYYNREEKHHIYDWQINNDP